MDSLERQFEGHLALAFVNCDGSQTPLAISHFRDAMFLVDETGSFGHMRLCLVHGLIQRELGEHTLTVHLIEKYNEAIAEMMDPAESALSLELLGMAFFRMGRSADAHELWADAERCAQETGGGTRVGFILGWHAVAYLHQQRWQDAAEYFARSEDVYRAIGPAFRGTYASAGLAAARAKLGDPVQEIAPLQRAVRLAEAKFHIRQESLWLRYLGETLLAVGDVEGALEALQRSAEISLRCRLYGRMRATRDLIIDHLSKSRDDRLLGNYREYHQLEQRMVAQSLTDRETSLQLLESIREWNRKNSIAMLEV